MASGDIPPTSQGATASEQEDSLVSGLKESHRLEAHALLHNSHCEHPGREPQGSVPSTGSVRPGLVLGFSERTPIVSRH